MKKNLSAILQSTVLLSALLGIVSVVHAQTWTPPPAGTPPSGNTAAPINVGAATQFRTGALGLGEASSTTVSNTATGFTLEVNGPTSTNGLASFGESYITDFTHIGPIPTCSGSACYYQATDYSALQVVSAPSSKSFALDGKKSFFGNLVDKLAVATETIFRPITAYALGYNVNGVMTPPRPAPAYGPCYGYFCSSEQYCDASTKTCQNLATGTHGYDNTAAAPAGKVSLMNLNIGVGTTTSATSTMYTLASPGTLYLVWNASGASACSISSSNITSNWNSGALSLNSNGFGRGNHSITFTAPGTYTYTLDCDPASGAMVLQGSTAAVATVVVGPDYIFQVNGNSSFEGYIISDGIITSNGGFVEKGKRVCLQDGTNCLPMPNTIKLDTPVTQWNGSGNSTIARSVIVNNSLNIDGTNTNTNGNLTGNALTFGSNSGQGIASRTTSGSPCQYSLSFFTNGVSRMDMCNGTTAINGTLGVTGDISMSGYSIGNVVDVDNQGGSLELGGNSMTSASQVPYIDFHKGVGSSQDYNFRIINDGNNTLSFYANGGYKVMYLDSAGVHIRGNALQTF